jgi:PKD repeat protein
MAEFTISGTLIQGESISFTNISQGATSQNWHFGDGQTSTVINPTHVYASVSDFSVALTSINEFGCTDIATQTVQIVTGLSDQGEFTLYPIPTQDKLLLKTYGETYEWKIFNGTGQIVLHGNTTQSNEPIPVQALPPRAILHKGIDWKG